MKIWFMRTYVSQTYVRFFFLYAIINPLRCQGKLFAKISVFSIPERKRGYRFIWYPPKNLPYLNRIYLSPISQLYISSYCFAE